MITRACAALLTVLSICGCATTSSPTTAANAAPSSCLTATGSRISAPPGGCTAVGRSYSQTDLQQTGKTTAAGALANLDPSVTISH